MKHSPTHTKNTPPATVSATQGAARWLHRNISKAALLIMVAFMSMTRANAQITVTLSTPSPVAAASMCPGTSQQTIYSFTLVAAGIPSLTTHFTALTFTQSGTATSADILEYKLWSGSAGGTLVATSTTPSFSGFSNTFSGLTGTTINYWITADISPSATAGRTIVVSPITTADFVTTSGLRTTFGTIATGGAQTVLQAPGAISGTASVCIGAATTLGNAISGGTWSSSDPTLAIAGSATGTITGVAAGMPVITYQLPTSCFTTKTVTVNALPSLYTMTGGGSYCADGAGVHVGLSGSATGVNYQLYRGTSSVSFPAGTGAALDFGAQTTAGVYSVVATNASTGCSRNMIGTATVAINPLPNAYSMTGGGSYCAGGTGLHVGLSGTDAGISYRLYRGSAAIGAAVTGTGAALDLGNYTAPGTYTVSATNSATGCMNDMAGSASIVVNPLPASYIVLGGGNYCAGGTGRHIRLSWSQTGVIYILYNGSSTVGAPVPGTGLLLDFGEQTAPGTYTVLAMDAATLCTRNMIGSATITVDPLPHVFSVTGGGSYCADGIGVHVGLDSSETGVAYMLYNGAAVSGSPVTGTGTAIDFGLKTSAGAYTVLAVNSTTTCLNNMAGSAAVVVNPLPLVYSVTGGGSYCDGSTGVHIGLSGSNSGISYRLYNGSTAVGSPLAGTGASLDFGPQTLAGVYTVQATNSTTMCAKNMTGSSSVIINPLPAVFNVTGGGYYCTSGPITGVITPAAAGGVAIHVGTDGSEPGMIYLLNNGSGTVGSPVAGTGGPLDFGVQYASGTYSVLAMNPTTLCTRNMTGTAIVTINPVVIPTLDINGISAVSCAGTTDTFHALTTNAGTTPVYVWKVNGATVGAAASYSYIPVHGDTVSVEMTSSAICAEPATVTDFVVMNVIAPIIPTVEITANPGTHISAGQTVTFTANVTDGGTAPACQWYKNASAIAGATSLTYTTASLVDGDSISCKVTRNDACAMSATNSVKISVGLSVAPATANSNISVMPNPSNGTFAIKGSIGHNDQVSLSITNMLGQSVYSKNVITDNGTIDENVRLENAAPGMYVLTILTGAEKRSLHITVQ